MKIEREVVRENKESDVDGFHHRFVWQVYENNPTGDVASTNQKSKGNYSCKKCGVVFSGYYELIKHQKRVCMKNNIVPLPFGNQV